MSSIALLGLDTDSSSFSSSSDIEEALLTRGITPRGSVSSATSSSDNAYGSDSLSSSEEHYRRIVVYKNNAWSRSSSAAAPATAMKEVGKKKKNKTKKKAQESAKAKAASSVVTKSSAKKVKKKIKKPKRTEPLPTTTATSAGLDDPRTDRIVLTRKEREAYEAAQTAPLLAYSDEQVALSWNEGVRDHLVAYAITLNDRDLVRRANALPTYSVDTETRLGDLETNNLEEAYTDEALTYVDRVLDSTGNVNNNAAYVELEQEFERAKLDVRREFKVMLDSVVEKEREALYDITRRHTEQAKLSAFIETEYARLDTLDNAVKVRALQRQLIDLRASFTANQRALRSKTTNLGLLMRRKYDLLSQLDGALADLWAQHARDQMALGAKMLVRDRRLTRALNGLVEFRETSLGRNSNIREGFRTDRLRSNQRRRKSRR